MRLWTSPLEKVTISTVGSRVASVNVLPFCEIMPRDVGELEIVNVCPARGPVLIVPLSTPITSLVQLPSSFTVYVKEKLKSSEPALWTFAGIVIPMDEPLTVPVPSPLNVRMPSDVNDCPKEPSVGVKLGLNPGPGAAVERQATVPVKP